MGWVGATGRGGIGDGGSAHRRPSGASPLTSPPVPQVDGGGGDVAAPVDLTLVRCRPRVDLCRTVPTSGTVPGMVVFFLTVSVLVVVACTAAVRRSAKKPPGRHSRRDGGDGGWFGGDTGSDGHHSDSDSGGGWGGDSGGGDGGGGGGGGD